MHGLHHLKRVFAGRTGQHREIAGHAALFRGIEKPPLHVATNETCRLHSKQHNRKRHDRIARPDDTRHERAEQVFFHPIKTTVHEPRRRIVPFVATTGGKRFVHVVRQNEETFDQRRDKDDDHRKRNIGDQIAKPPANKHQRKEGDDRREGRRKHRTEHLFRSIFSGNGGAFAKMPVAVISVFANNNGVVHHDPQGDNQREQRYHVDGQSRRIHQRNRTAHGHRNTRRNPERGARIQEHEQQRDHHREAEKRVLIQDIQAPRDQFGARTDQINTGPSRQRRRIALRDLFNGLLHLDGVTRRGAVNANGDGGIVADKIRTLTVDTLNEHPRDIANRQGRATGVRSQNNRLNLIGGAFFDAGPNAGRSGYIASGIASHLLCDSLRNIGHRDVVADQRKRGDFDDRGRCRNAANGRACDALCE